MKTLFSTVRRRQEMAPTMTRALAAIALALLTLPSVAEEVRERIPDGCRELADRAGLPLTLTHAEASRAIAYLSIMSSGDPAVVRCRLAILRR
jgi:hypothetical protein